MAATKAQPKPREKQKESPTAQVKGFKQSINELSTSLMEFRGSEECAELPVTERDILLKVSAGLAEANKALGELSVAVGARKKEEKAAAEKAA